MKIIHRSPDALVVRDAQAVLRYMGAGMCALAGWIWWIGLVNARGDAVETVPAIASFVLAVGGALLVVLPARLTFAFDVRGRALITTRRSLLRGVTRTEIAFRDIAAVEVQRSTDNDGGTMYRLVTRLKNGATVPWTSYLTSIGQRSMREISAAAGEMIRNT